MRVGKNKKAPPHRDVAILLDENTILTEFGEMAYDRTLSETKIYASRKLIGEIFFKKKVGEILKYNGEIIKWRKKCPPHYKHHSVWHFSNPKEVHVNNSRNFPEDPIKALEAYIEYRDWVESYGGNIVGTVSATSWSLFKTTLSGGIWETPYNSVPGIEHPIGGRVLPCKSKWTSFQGEFINWDLNSAYSRRLSELAFGGKGSRWIETRKRVNFDKFVSEGKCVYIEADINLESTLLGPLPKRRARYNPRTNGFVEFPNQGSITGIWTYEEVRAAIHSGASISRLHRTYIHAPTGQEYFFKDWHRIIQEGRDNLDGFARGLAKQTGNALWGRFAMQHKAARTCWRENGKRVAYKHPIRTLKRNQCMELADQLCGKIRSDLYEFARSADNLLLQGNTDGAWIIDDKKWRPPNDDWRIKNRANEIDIIDDITYRYRREGEADFTYIVPGVGIEWTEKHFDGMWENREARVL